MLILGSWFANTNITFTLYFRYYGLNTSCQNGISMILRVNNKFAFIVTSVVRLRWSGCSDLKHQMCDWFSYWDQYGGCFIVSSLSCSFYYIPKLGSMLIGSYPNLFSLVFWKTIHYLIWINRNFCSKCHHFNKFFSSSISLFVLLLIWPV